MAMYTVSLAGSWSVNVDSEGPQLAASKALIKNEPSLAKGNFVLKVDKVAPQVTVTLAAKGKRKFINKYRIETSVPINTNVSVASDSILQSKMDVIKEFRKKSADEQRRYADYVEKNYGDSIDHLLEWEDSVKAGCKRMIKGGASARDCANDFFKKNSLNVEEMIMTAQNFSGDFIDIDVKDIRSTDPVKKEQAKQNILKALSEHPCMILARNAKGGVTGYMCTTNLNLHSALYEPNMFVYYSLTDVYNRFLDINKRKLDYVLNPREKEQKERKEYVEVASCSMRLKEGKVYNRSLKVYESTGVFEVSSSSYSLVFENVLLMKAFNGNSPVDTTVTQYLGAALMNYSEEDFNAKFKFDRKAYTMAMKTVQTQALPKNELLIELQKRATEQEITPEDLQAYVNAKWESLVREVQWVIRQLSTGSTTGK